MAKTKPTDSGVFITWDEEEVDAEGRDIDTVRARRVVVARRTVTVYARWSNAVTPETIAAAERHAASIKDEYANVRVQVFKDGAQV